MWYAGLVWTYSYIRVAATPETLDDHGDNATAWARPSTPWNPLSNALAQAVCVRTCAEQKQRATVEIAVGGEMLVQGGDL
jgi:hypothetical protein